jgi:hypothetical protein
MRIHDNQLDTILQVNALASAAKAHEEKEAERVRKMLSERASALAAKDEADCVVKLSGDGEPDEESSGQNRQEDQQQEEQASQDGSDDTFSHWA